MLFARYYHGQALPRLHELADLASTRYGHAFLCSTDIPYENTWDRSGEIHREQMQEWTVQELHRRGIRYTELRGSAEQRLDTALRMLPV
jgi:fructosamine-3-kinase